MITQIYQSIIIVVLQTNGISSARKPTNDKDADRKDTNNQTLLSNSEGSTVLSAIDNTTRGASTLPLLPKQSNTSVNTTKSTPETQKSTAKPMTPFVALSVTGETEHTQVLQTSSSTSKLVSSFTNQTSTNKITTSNLNQQMYSSETLPPQTSSDKSSETVVSTPATMPSSSAKNISIGQVSTSTTLSLLAEHNSPSVKIETNQSSSQTTNKRNKFDYCKRPIVEYVQYNNRRSKFSKRENQHFCVY